MCSLSKEDKDIVLDFYFRCGDEETINRGRDLVAANPEAAILYAQLEETLTQLDSIKYEPCPENLVELTIARLKLAASSGQTQLEKLLELEHQKGDSHTQQTQPSESLELVGASAGSSSNWSFGESFFRVSSLAAVVLIMAGIAWPTLRNMRQTAWRITCARNLNTLGAGLVRYAQDNNGYIPQAAGIGTRQWSRVGEAGSHTSSPFLLYKGGYAAPRDFTCPGDAAALDLKLPDNELAKWHDFASRNNISYSFRVLCDKSDRRLSGLRGPIMVDVSPIFQDLRASLSNGPVELDDQMRKCLSTNHGCSGQNILSTDGSVRFIRVRLLGNDDIFTIDNVNTYYGHEAPGDPLDAFFP